MEVHFMEQYTHDGILTTQSIDEVQISFDGTRYRVDPELIKQRTEGSSLKWDFSTTGFGLIRGYFDCKVLPNLPWESASKIADYIRSCSIATP